MIILSWYCEIKQEKSFETNLHTWKSCITEDQIDWSLSSEKPWICWIFLCVCRRICGCGGSVGAGRDLTLEAWSQAVEYVSWRSHKILVLFFFSFHCLPAILLPGHWHGNIKALRAWLRGTYYPIESNNTATEELMLKKRPSRSIHMPGYTTLPHTGLWNCQVNLKYTWKVQVCASLFPGYCEGRCKAIRRRGWGTSQGGFFFYAQSEGGKPWGGREFMFGWPLASEGEKCVH